MFYSDKPVVLTECLSHEDSLHHVIISIFKSNSMVFSLFCQK